MNLISQEFIRTIAPQLDLLNTVGGGIAQATLRVDKGTKGVLIRVAAPSVRPENFHVVLNNANLTIFCEYRHQPADQLAMPLFTRTLALPPALDLTRIDAEHQGQELRIRIPYLDSATEPREIDIRQS